MEDLVLIKLDTARTALAEAKTIQETKNILDIAVAAEVYAKRQQLGEEAILYATSIKVEALAQLGRMLKETVRAKGGQPYQGYSTGTQLLPVELTLSEMGLDKRTSKLAQDIASLPDEQIEKIKSGVVAINKATTEARRKERIEIITSQPPGLETVNKKYNVILADPPWRYEYSISSSRDIENQYPTMELSDICNLEVQKISADDCVLLLWATSPKLTEALQVMSAWGFSYRTCMVWIKDKIGMGYYTRQQHEILLIGAKGYLPMPAPENRVSSVVYAPRNEHSKKPDVFYGIINKMYPEYPKIELFSRQTSEGFDSWGNQNE